MKGNCVWPALAFMRTRTRGPTLDIILSLPSPLRFLDSRSKIETSA